MRKYLPAIVLLLSIALLPGAHASVTLTYKMAKGETLKYQCTSVGEGSIAAMGRTGPLAINAAFRYLMSCTDVDAAGNMTLVSKVDNLSVNATWDGEAIPVNLAIPQITTVMTPGGTVIKTQVLRNQQMPGSGTGGLSGGLAQAAVFDVGQFFGKLHAAGFPAGAVEPGSRWKQTLNLKSQTGQPMTVSYETTLLDFATLTERDCARLQTRYSMPLDLSLLGGGLFNLKGEQTGTQISYFDYEAGRPLRFDGTSDAGLVMQTPQLFGGAGGTQTAVTMHVRTTTTVVLQP